MLKYKDHYSHIFFQNSDLEMIKKHPSPFTFGIIYLSILTKGTVAEMNAIDLIILNFEEVRRRSIKVWKAIPQQKLNWKPDGNALSCAEMIRHVLESEYIYLQILIARGSTSLTNLSNPFDRKEFTTVEDDLAFAQPYREEFLNYIKSSSASDLETIKIDRSDVGYVRTLGDMLLRIAYHESIHTGQLLDYMRTMGIDRPLIWD